MASWRLADALDEAALGNEDVGVFGVVAP